MWLLGGIGTEAGNGPPDIPSTPSGVSVSRRGSSSLSHERRGQHSSLPPHTVHPPCGSSHPAQKSPGFDLWWLAAYFWTSAAAQLVYGSHLHPPSHPIPPPDLKESNLAFPEAWEEKPSSLAKGSWPRQCMLWCACSEVSMRKPAGPWTSKRSCLSWALKDLQGEGGLNRQ